MVYFVVGPSGVGKTIFSKMVNKKYEIPVYDTGPILRNIYTNLKLKISFQEWINLNESIYGDNFAISMICDNIKKLLKSKKETIVIGNRCIEGINYFINYFNLNDYKIIYLDASYACLKKNYETREKKCISDDEFQERINGGNKMGLTILKEYVLRNLKNNCLYYYKNGNEDIDYINIFDEISKRKSEKKI